MIDFSDRVLVLTGACGGIGRAVARLFFDHGALLVLTDIDAAALDAAASDLGGGERILTVVQDAARADDADKVADLCQTRFGGCDFVVNSAGIYKEGLLAEMDDETWRQTIAVNLDGTFYTCRAMTPLMRDGGAIVNLASVAGHRGSFRHGHYAASKGGVMGLTKSLAWELAPAVRVNAVSPGIIDTPMVKPLMEARGPQLLEATPLGRLGTSEEVAGVIAFLCSDLASFVTGETIHVNGGLYIAG